jgi:hypothetical protein
MHETSKFDSPLTSFFVRPHRILATVFMFCTRLHYSPTVKTLLASYFREYKKNVHLHTAWKASGAWIAYLMKLYTTCIHLRWNPSVWRGHWQLL